VKPQVESLVRESPSNLFYIEHLIRGTNVNPIRKSITRIAVYKEVNRTALSHLTTEFLFHQSCHLTELQLLPASLVIPPDFFKTT
jgi:hypothetical protein